MAELSGNSAAGDFAALYGAADLPELVAVANLLEPGLAAWLLLHPTGGRQAVMMTRRGQEPLDPLAASQISHIPIPGESEPVTSETSWAKTLLGLLHYQCHGEGTDLLVPIWMSGSLLAITGISGMSSSAEALARTMVLGVRRLHEIDTLRRDVEGHRFLLDRSGKNILLALGSGRILAGTESGLAILRQLQTGGDTDILPVSYRRAIEAGDKQVIQDDLRAAISHPPLLPAYTTAEPLVAIRFSRRVAKASTDKLQTLSPAERRVWDRLLSGDRNKEIADRVGLSKHTVRHHVSAILQKTGYPDRVLLLAGAKPQPKVAPLPVINLLPPPKKLIVGKRTVPEKA